MNKIQLFCIPYAGGGAEVFDELKNGLPENIELVAFDYSGHGMRKLEPFYQTFDDMVNDMARQMNAAIRSETMIAVFGYSMGSVVAYEILARNLLNAKPCHLFLAAHEAPGEVWESAGYAQLDDLGFVEKMKALGGLERLQERTLGNKFFRKLYFQPLREDYRLIADYQLKHDVKLDLPVTMMYSPEDVAEEKVRKWSDCFENKVEFIEIGSNHFFMKEYPQQVAEIISRSFTI